MAKKSKGKGQNSRYVPPVDLSDDEAMNSSDDELSSNHKVNDYDIPTEFADYKALDSSSDDEESVNPARWDKLQKKELERIEKQSKSWGKNREAYYNADTMDYEIESDDDIANQEEKEAIRLQKEQAAEFNDQDFGLDDIITPFATSKASSSTSSSSVISSSIKSGKKFDIATEEKIKHILSESPELLSLLDDFTSKMEVLREEVIPLIKQAHDEGSPTEVDDGFALLQTREQLLLAFLNHILFYLLLKSEGQPVQNHPVIKRILHLRSLLEKTDSLTERMYDFIRQVVDPAGWEADQKSDELEEDEDNLDIEGMDEDMELDNDEFDAFEDESELVPSPINNKIKLSEEEVSRLNLEEANYTKMLAQSSKASKRKSKSSDIHLATKKYKRTESLADGLDAYDDYAELSGVQAVERARKTRMEDVRMAFEDARAHPSKILFGAQEAMDDEDDFEIEKDDDTMDKNLAAYKKIASANQEKQRARHESFKKAPVLVGKNTNLIDEDERRSATARIVKNRGLVRSRGKLDANPRAKHRAKHDKALIKRRSQVKEFTGSKGDDYTGEKGIKKNILRFRKIN